MQLVQDKITLAELSKMCEKMHKRLVKAVVDIEKGIMVVDAEAHCDEEELLLEQGSQQDNLWGINFYPDLFGDDDWIEFDSMINVRPVIGNRSRGVDNPQIQKAIRKIAAKLVVP